MLLPPVVRTPLAVLVFVVLATSPAFSDTLDFEGMRMEVPAGFSSVGNDPGYFREWLQRRLTFPRYHRPDEAEFRLFQRTSEEEFTDLVIVARVPGESRSADDPVVEHTFCRSIAESHDAALGPVECGVRTTARGVVGIEILRVERFELGTETEFLFLVLRSDDLVALFVRLAGNRRAEAEAIRERLLDSLENDRSLPPASNRQRHLPLHVSLGLILGVAVALIVAWRWWLRRMDRWRPRGARGRPNAPKRV